MIKKITIALVAAISLFAKTEVIDNLNETTHVNLSNSDVNRLVFPYDITFQANSKEKDLTITVVGKELYVKFMPYIEQEQTTIKNEVVNSGESKINYDKSKASELFIVTDKKTYSLIVHPKKQEATTVIFTETFSEKKEKLFVNKDAEYVDNIVNNILKQVFIKSDIKGFEKEKIDGVKSKIIMLKDIKKDVVYKHKVTYSGYRYDVFEYSVFNPNIEPINILDTKEILLGIAPALKKKILAYSLFYGNRVYKIMPNSEAKLLIVTEAGHD